MAKAGDFKLTWKRSTSEDVSRQLVKIVNDGEESSMELAPDIEELAVSVAAGKDFSFKVVSVRDFVESESADHAFTCPSLEPPEPATELSHELTGQRDV